MQSLTTPQIKKLSGTLTTAQLQDVSLMDPILTVQAGLKIFPLMVFYDIEISNNTNINEFGLRLNNQLNPFLILAIVPGAAPYAWSGIIGQTGFQTSNPAPETNPLCNELNFTATPDPGIAVNYFRYEITYFIL